MSNGYKVLSFVSPAGDMEIQHILKFIEVTMEKYKIDESMESIRIDTPYPLGVVDDPLGMPDSVEVNPPKIHKVRSFPEFSLDLSDKLKKNLRSFSNVTPGQINKALDEGSLLRELVKEEWKPIWLNFCKSQLFSIISKRKPEFYVPDLNTDTIYELTEKYINNMGGSELVGVHVDLSKFQKFFMITQKDAFRLWMYENYHLIRNARDMYPSVAVEARGVVTEMKPNKWVLGRYDEMTYLQEWQQHKGYGGPGSL